MSLTKNRISNVSQRKIIQYLKSLLKKRPDLAKKYEKARTVVRAFRRPAFYEISTRCNLSCEGCYYFDNSTATHTDTNEPLEKWDEFFASEAKRGVSMAYFVGAEPAMDQERLLIASRYFHYGNIGTNGTIPIPPSVPFRIGVSVWGIDNTDIKLRNSNAFHIAVKNFEGDPRAIMLYTVTHWNINQIRKVTNICFNAGLELTFNLYSPTHSFISKLAAYTGNSGSYFRVSAPDDNPCLTNNDLARTRDVIGQLIDDYPDTVIYSHQYNIWSTNPGPCYKIDPQTGIAQDCHSRVIEPMRYYTTSLQQIDVKCCTPSVDCSQCRMYSGGWSSKFVPTMADVESPEAFEKWSHMIEILGRIFLFEKNSSKGISTF